MEAADAMTAENLAHNVTLTLIARFAMILAAGMLPILGSLGLFFLNRGVSSVDQVSGKLDAVQVDIGRMREQAIEINGNVKLIQQMQQLQSAAVADHETRLRAQEARPR